MIAPEGGTLENCRCQSLPSAFRGSSQGDLGDVTPCNASPNLSTLLGFRPINREVAWKQQILSSFSPMPSSPLELFQLLNELVKVYAQCRRDAADRTVMVIWVSGRRYENHRNDQRIVQPPRNEGVSPTDDPPGNRLRTAQHPCRSPARVVLRGRSAGVTVRGKSEAGYVGISGAFRNVPR